MATKAVSGALVGVCVVVSLAGLASADSIVLAHTGGTAPSGHLNPEPNGLYVDFTVPVLNSGGQIAFQSDLEGTMFGEVSDTAIFRVDSEEGTIIAQGYFPLPSWQGRFKSFYSPAINYMGQVAFWAENHSGRTGIYCGTGDAIPTQIVRENEPLPDGNGRFDKISKYVLRPLDIMGNVAFRASLKDTAGGTSDDTAIVLTLGSVPKLVAREGSLEPITTNIGYYMDFPSHERVALSEVGEVAFRATIDFPNWDHPMSGIISGRSSLHLQVYEGQSAPGGGYFSSFGQPSIHQTSPYEPSTVAFLAFLQNTPGGVGNDDIGLYQCRGTNLPDTIARRGDPPPDGNGLYDNFSTEISPNYNNMAAFRATMRNTSSGTGLDGDGIYRYQHTDDITETIKIARGGEPAPGGNGVLYTLYQPVLNSGGQVAFAASLWDTAGGVNDNEAIYIGDGLILVEVARKGDPLLGSTITSLHFATGSDSLNGFNDHSQVAYHVNLADGREALLLATPLVQWIGDNNGGWGDNANWTLGIEPAEVHDVVITPGHSVEVAGPRTDTTVKSLTLGTPDGGAATLNLTGAGDLTALGEVAIGTDGHILVGGGRTLSAGALLNQGTLVFDAGQGHVLGDVTNGPGGRILVPAGANAWMHGPLENTGVLEVAPGGVVHLYGLTGNGSMGAGGTTWLEGDVRPGLGVGQMGFEGDVILGRGCVMHIELGGLVAGLEHDQLLVEGDLVLDGLLEVTLVRPFELEPGQYFEIIDVAGTAEGQFSGLGEGDVVGNYGGVDLLITYAAGNGNDVALFAIPEPSSALVLILGVCAFRRRRGM